MTTKTTLIALVIIGTGYSASSQNCNLIIKEGSKVTVTAYSWANANLSDPKFQKLKDGEKDEQILAYNQSVLSGKLAPASTYPMNFTVKKGTTATGGDEFILTT